MIAFMMFVVGLMLGLGAREFNTQLLMWRSSRVAWDELGHYTLGPTEQDDPEDEDEYDAVIVQPPAPETQVGQDPTPPQEQRRRRTA